MPAPVLHPDPLKVVMDALEAKAISVPRLAVLSGVDRPRIYRIRNGERDPAYSTVLKLYHGLQKHLGAGT